MNKEEHISKLPRSPLQEVIFELFLKEEVDSRGVPTSDKYELSKGVFAREIESSFPLRILKPTPPKNIKIFPNISYQFWKEDKKWPVVQLGNGLLTVNETDKNYTWDKFYSMVEDCIEILEKSYNEPLKINKVSLRYIDAVELPEMPFNEKLNFINDNFNFSLINKFEIPDSVQSGLHISQTYKIKDDSIINFVISNGLSNRRQPAIVWQSQISKDNIKNKEEIFDWLRYGHDLVSDLFKNTVTKEYYEHFK